MDWERVIGQIMLLGLVIWAAWAMYEYEGFRKGVGYTILGFLMWMFGSAGILMLIAWIILKVRGN